MSNTLDQPRTQVWLVAVGVALVLGGAVVGALPVAGASGSAPPLNQGDDDLKSAGSNTTTQDDGTSAASSSTIGIEYTLNRTPNDLSTLTITATVHPPDNLVNFTFFTDGATVISASGFTKVGSNAWQWSENSSVQTPTLRYTIPSNVSGEFGQEAVETATWAFTDSRYALGYRYWYQGQKPSVTITERTVGAGYVGNYWAFLGQYTTAKTSATSQSFTYVVPTAAEPRLARDRVLAYLRNLSRAVDTGARDSTVTMFTVPSPPIRGGGVSVDDEFWVSDGLYFSTIAHEYTHTRQEFRYESFSNRMDWVVEGHAEYRGYYYEWRLTPSSTDTFRYRLVSGSGLSQPLADVGATSAIAYEKGALTLAKIDLLIRNRSDGKYTLEDVFREINTRSYSQSQLTLQQFETVIVQTTGVSVNATFERFVTTDATPSLPTNLNDAYTIAPRYEITAVRAPSSVTRGSAVSVAVTLTNTGEADDTRTMTLRVNGTTVATRSVSLASGATTTINTTFSTDSLVPGSYTLTVATPNDTRTTQFTVQELAGFQVSNLDAPDNVTAETNVTVAATLTNTGDVEDTQTVDLRFNGTTVASKRLTLEPNTSTTIAFDLNTSVIGSGTYTYGIYTANDSETATLTVASPVSVALVPANTTGRVNGTVTYELVVRNVSGGVGAYNLSVSVGNTSVADLTALTVRDTSGIEDVAFGPNNESARIMAAIMDTADTGTVSLATITFEGESIGTTALLVQVETLADEEGSSLEVGRIKNATLTVTDTGLSALPGHDNPPTDPDDDGVYEDVNGDGEVSLGDVQALFAYRDSQVIQNNPGAFDFNGDSEFSLGDVQALFVQITS